MKCAVLLMSLLLATGLAELRSAGLPIFGIVSSNPFASKTPPPAKAPRSDFAFQIDEDSSLIFYDQMFGDATEFLELIPVAIELPSGANMPYVSGYDYIRSYFVWTPTFCQSGPYDWFDVKHFVDGQLESTNHFLITVNNVNRAPYFETPAFMLQRQINALEDTISILGSMQLNPTAHDSDCIQCGDDTLYMSYVADPPSPSIVFTDLGLGVSSFLWTPTSADSGWHTVTFTATDAHDTSATQVWNILVRVNHAPTITSTVPGQLQLRVGQNYHLNLTAFDYDFQQFGDDTLKMTYSTTPSAISASLADNGGGSATFNWTPIATERGDHTITFRVTDFFGLMDAKQMLVQVYACGDANDDGSVDISDVVYLISYIFSGGSAPAPLLAGDANCDQTVDISDVVYLISYIFSSGTAPCTTCK
jgi:hypothetical protein